MKSTVILISMLLGSLTAYASTAEDVFNRGLKLIEKFEKDGQMDYLLNPIICEGNTSGQISLIFSDDFRHQEDAYLIDGELVMKAKTSKLKITRGTGTNKGAVAEESIVYKGERMTCAYSTMVLEMPGRN